MVYQDWARFRLDFALPMTYASFYNEGDPWVLDRLREAQDAIDGAFPILPGLHIPDFYDRPDALRALTTPPASASSPTANSAASSPSTPLLLSYKYGKSAREGNRRFWQIWGRLPPAGLPVCFTTKSTKNHKGHKGNWLIS